MFRKLSLMAMFLFLIASTCFAAEKTLTVAHDATWPPMEYINSNKDIVGYSVDYTDAVAKELDIKLVHKNVAWDGIFAGLAGKKYDFVASSVTITDERKEAMAFTDPYYEVVQAVIVPKEANISNIANLKGKTIGAQLGTTGFFASKKVENATQKPFDEIGFAIEALYNGRLDAVICDEPVAVNFALANEKYAGKFKVAFIIGDADKEYYGFAVSKDNKELVDLLNKGIASVKAKGIEDQLKAKWFGKK